MKANNGKGDRTERDEWETPQELFETLDTQYHFDFDCCADPLNHKTTEFSNNFESIDKHFLSNRMCWMNPPFSKDRRMFEHFFKVVNQGVAIYRCDNMETKLWQEVILPNADWVFIPKGRINFEGLGGNGCRFPSALIGVCVSPPERLEGITFEVDTNERRNYTLFQR